MAAKAPPSRFDWWGFVLLCAIFLVVCWLWNTVWVYPLRLFVVLLHETSHGLVALATGGRILEIRVFANEGGCCTSEGGNAFLVASAGYLGSMLFGVAILLVATRTRLSQWAALLLGVGAVALALRVMPSDNFGRHFATAAGIVLAGLAPMPRIVSELVLRVVGVTSCLYAILDIKSDILDRQVPISDAAELARITHVPQVVWGVAWIGISLYVTWFAATIAVTGAKAEPKAKTAKA